MRRINIKDKLDELQTPLQTLSLGEYDQIGEFTAKKTRHPNDPLFRSVGAFFRPNYERGILISSLIKRFEAKTFFEIGFGRGYASFCAARAMCDMGWDDAAVYSVDPNLDENHLKNLTQVFPREWFDKLNLIRGNVNDALLNLPESIDIVYIDGDHRYEAVKYDWEAIRGRFKKFVLFDDYDPRSTSPDMQVAKFIDELDVDKELVISDRRIFLDDRGMPDADVTYGQVLVKHPEFDTSGYLLDW